MTDSSEKQLELMKLNHSIIEKTSFMFLTATTASIAYILTQIEKIEWSKLIYFPMASLALLGLSFLLGGISLNSMAKITKSNSIYLSNQIPPIYKDIAKQELNRFVKNSHYTSQAQQYFFFIGILVYAIYIFIKIYMKAHPLPFFQ